MFNLHLDFLLQGSQNKMTLRKLLAPIRQRKKNPKSEYRNPKQTGDLINPKLEKLSNPEADLDLFGIFGVSNI
jgi:hypothetical protein